MLVLEPITAARVVARPDAIDAALANWPGSQTPASPVRDGSPRLTAPGTPAGAGPLLRLAVDELLALGATPADLVPLLAPDRHAIVVGEAGFSAVSLTWDQFEVAVAPHVEWHLPRARPCLAQGLVAGVPAKLWCTTDGVLVVVATAYAHDLAERLV